MVFHLTALPVSECINARAYRGKVNNMRIIFDSQSLLPLVSYRHNSKTTHHAEVVQDRTHEPPQPVRVI